MKFLLFLLGLIFFFIFYLFSQIGGVEGFFLKDLFWIANIYVFVTLIIISVLLFSPSGKTLKTQSNLDGNEEQKQKIFPSLEELKNFIKDFFSTYIYYIACLLFYGAFYLILKSSLNQVNISLLFFVLNIIVISLYFIEEKIKIFQDFVRVNLVLISLYYMCIHIYYLLGGEYVFSFVDVLNILGVFLLFGILLKSKRAEGYFNMIRHYFIAFSFLEIAVFVKIFLGGELLSLGFIAGVGGISFLVFTENIKYILGFSKGIIRLWGVIFLVIFTFISCFYIGREDFYSLSLIPALGFSSYILFLFHEKFQNYIALSSAMLGFMISAFGIYGIIFSEAVELYYIGFLCFLFSVTILVTDRYYFKGSIYDTYFFHSLSLLVNLLGVFCFLYFRDISILSLGLLLLGESIYLFFSYYTISKIKGIG